MKLRLPSTLALFAALVLPIALAAQQDTLATQGGNDSISIDGVVITAQYQPGSASNAVHRIQVIDRAKIDAMGAQNLRDVLTNQLNLRISQDAVLGSGINMQGMGGQNVKVLVDGVAVIGRLDGNIDLSQLNLRDVERIEVVEGPLSVSYGTDALAGTINIITKKSQKKELSLGADSYYESNGHYNLSGRIGLRKGQNLWSVSGGRYYFDGWSPHDPTFQYISQAFADSSRFQSWKPKEQWMARLNWGRYIGTKKLDYTSNAFLETIVNRGLPRAPYQETAFDDRYRTLRMDHALRLNGEVGKAHYLSLQAATNYYRRLKNTWLRDLTTLTPTLTPNIGDQDSSTFWDHSTRGTLSSTRKSSKWNYELGYDAHLETASGIRIEEGRRRLGEVALFGSMELAPAKGLLLRPGLRYAYNSAYRAPLVPSLNIKYAIGKFTLRAAYARGFRAPSLKELYLSFQDINHDITGNTNLKAELGHHLSYSTIYSPTLKQGKLQLEVNAFYNSIQNLITLAQTTGNSYSYTNIGHFETQGLQAKAEYSRGKLLASLGGSITGRLNALPDTVEAARFSYSPELRASLMYEIKPLAIKVALFYKFTGRMQSFALDENGALTTQRIAAYQTADCSFTRSFWKGNLGLGLGAKNLFNVTQIAANIGDGAHSGGGNSMQVGTGRSYFVQLNLLIQSQQ